MKIIIAVIIIFASYPLFAEDSKGLPQYFDMTELKLNNLPYSKNIYINAAVTIPNNHKTSGYPSSLRIYEKIKGYWVKSVSLKSNPLLSTNDKVIFSGRVELQSQQSEVAIDSTIYHCGKYCVINNFQGIAKRDLKSQSRHLNISMEGYLPTDKLKSSNAPL